MGSDTRPTGVGIFARRNNARLLGHKNGKISLVRRLFFKPIHPLGKEKTHFYIDSAWFFELRRVFLECGRRFARLGLIDNPNVVFLMRQTEVERALRTGSAPRMATLDIRRDEIIGSLTSKPTIRLSSHEGSDRMKPTVPPDDVLNRSLAKAYGLGDLTPAEHLLMPVCFAVYLGLAVALKVRSGY